MVVYMVPKQSFTIVQQYNNPEGIPTFPNLSCIREWLHLLAIQKTIFLTLWQLKQKAAKWSEALKYKQLFHSH